MAQELSSNWKKLQAQIKSESSLDPPSSKFKPKAKRKAEEQTPAHVPPKRHKSQQTSKQPLSPNPHNKSTHPKSRPAPNTFKKPMGVTQSSVIAKGTPTTITPSLALWAEDNDVSPEDLAEAYELGVKTNASLGGSEQDRLNEGLAPGVEIGKYIALDCEMVGVGPGGFESALARVSVVDFRGRQVYDSLVRPREPVTDWRTHVTGLKPGSLSAARAFDEVQAAVAALLRGRVLVGHDLRHDLAALELLHPAGAVRDTARFSGYRRYGHGPKPALRVLARDVLGVDVQAGHHSSLEDARVAMLLFRRRKSDFDVQHAARFGLPAEKTIASEAVGAGSGSSREQLDKSKKGPAKTKKKKKKKNKK
ncbi:ribonuclease H-like domain-containing protein [Hypoxylon sp. FL1284]|nr:ribonuclease H-like domain-containing protein [Hypoxylon sp. FL1284]